MGEGGCVCRPRRGRAPTSIRMRQYFPKPYEPFVRDINVRVVLSNFAAKTDIKNILHVDISTFVLKSNLASLKTEVYKLDIKKLVPAPVDLSKLSRLVKNNVVKKTLYDELVTKEIVLIQVRLF